MSTASEPGRTRRGERVLFVSDVHLTPAEPEIYLLFHRFLVDEAPGARALYLLGDVFDAWLGPRQLARPGYEPIFRTFRELRDSGTDLYFLPGNRDFLLRDPFAAAHGLTLLPDVAEARLGPRRVLLTHGDLLCTRDVDYHRMRRVIRSAPVRRLVDLLPWPLLARFAAGLRKKSGREIERKGTYATSPDFELAKRWLARGFDALIFGHVHRGERFSVRLEERTADLFILGSWEDRPGFVEWTGAELVLRPYGPSRRESLRAPIPLAAGSPPGSLPAAMAERPVIAVDGPAGSGKSTVARRLAERIGYRYLDSGAMYRAVALLANRRGVADEDEAGLRELLDRAAIELTEDGGVRLDGEEVSAEIRDAATTARVSRIAAVKAVREGMVGKQRAAFPGEPLVAEGRDIGSVVFPDARLKVYLTASAEERARRRAAQSGRPVAEVLAEQEERDRRDESRAHSPLVRAPGAVVVDTTGLTIDEVTSRLAELLQKAPDSPPGE